MPTFWKRTNQTHSTYVLGDQNVTIVNAAATHIERESIRKATGFT